jgi:hypothetical protein
MKTNQLRKSPSALVTSLKLLAALVSASFCLQASASTITVQATGDGAANAANCPGSGCRLRDALAAALDSDTISFSVTTPATITLTSNELVVDKSVTISGPGAANLAVNGNAAGRVFYVSSGKTVTISGITITNGNETSIDGDGIGGGIYNAGTLTVTNSTISNNSASVTDNFNFDSFGGGIYNAGTLTVTNSTISGNSLSDGDFTLGGGIYNNGTLTVTNSTLSDNSAIFDGLGGGIYNTGTLTVTNSTISGNSASYGLGGGIYNDNATLNIGDTILKTGASGANIYNDSGPVTSLGYNLSSDAGVTNVNGGTGGLTATGDQTSKDPMLGPLQDNGGPTFTHELLTGSPAIDQGKNFSGSTTDQRGTGFARTFDNPSIANATGGDGTDIGAFEVQTLPPCPLGQGDWKNNPNAWPVSSLTLGSQTYTKTELLTILKMKVGSGPKADASLILADQLIAAKLNIANGSDPTPVSSTITHADSLLSAFGGNKLPYKVKPSSATGQMMVNDANTLNSYNNGLLTPVCSP